MCVEAKNTENDFKDGDNVEDTDNNLMIRRRKYYSTRREAEEKRQRGDRIYYKAGKGFYIVRPKKRDWWDIF